MPLNSFGRYRVENVIASGGMGTVYKALDPVVQRPVAIKVLGTIQDPGLLSRFEREAKATGRLNHPNIVTVYDYGVQNETPYIAMEYLEGEDLQAILDSKRPLTIAGKVRIMAQVAQALRYAHENGILHRDIKPANIRVLSGGNVKVMDFGIARLIADGNPRDTQQGYLFGTVRYMAPEQLSGADFSAASDIFAFGLVFYELLSGKYPFATSNPSSTMYSIISDQPEPLKSTVSGCPPALERILMRALEKDPQKRYESFADLIVDLGPVQQDLAEEDAAALLEQAARVNSAGDQDAALALVTNALELYPGYRQAIERRAALQAEKADQRRRSSLKDGMAEAQTMQPPSPPPAAAPVDTGLPPPSAHESAMTVLVKRPVSPERTAPSPAEPSGGLTQIFRLGGSKSPTDSGVSRIPDAGEDPEDLAAELVIVAYSDPFRLGQSISIDTPSFVIGRSQNCNLPLTEDPGISRRHASIDRTGTGFRIADLASRNGIYVNGRKVPSGESEPLPLNAEIWLSNATRIRFRCNLSELPDFTGQELAGRYTLTRRIRAGPKTAYYEARDRRPVRKVAVKLLSPSLAKYPGCAEQLEHEAQTAAQLNHPNICRIYDSGSAPLQFEDRTARTVHFVCMEMLDGGSLAHRLDQPEHASPTAVAAWLDVVAAALNEAHRSGVVHAGLKPTSIVFSQTGSPFVTDFALAATAGSAGRPIVGAPEYLAPEQWEGLATTPECDQYSLACLCYRILTGAVPFENQADPAIRRRNFEQGPVPADAMAVRNGRSPVLPSLAAVLTRALSVEPEARYSSIAEFARAFRQALLNTGDPARKPRVFVSYRREADGGWAVYFADKLKTQHGIDVFVDRQRVDSARQVPEKIESAIRDCDYFVCLVGNTTFQSAWVRTEISIADAAGKHMIPVIHEGYKRPGRGIPGWLKPLVPAGWFVPFWARRLLNCEEVRLFTEYDESAIEKLARMILSPGPTNKA